MKRGIWFLIVVAGALSAIAGYTLLDDATSFPDDPAFDANSDGRRAKPAAAEFPHPSPQAVPNPAEANRTAISKRPIALSDALARKRLEDRELGRQHPMGIAGLISEAIDPQEIEKRILTEQLDESLRNPAYLSATFGTQFEIVDPDDSEEMEEDEDSLDEAAMHFSEHELALNDDDNEVEEESGLYLSDTGRELANEERSGERVLLTEAGIHLNGESESINWEEIENRRLNERLAESLGDPADQSEFRRRPALAETSTEED